MSFLTGYTRESLQPAGIPNPPDALSLLIVGSARDGLLNDPRFFNSTATARQAFSGKVTARITPAPSATSLILPSSFFPDDPTLTSRPPVIYHCPESSPYGVGFTGLVNLTGTNSLVDTITFDSLGYDSSTTPASGGIFIEAESLYSYSTKKNLSAGSGIVLTGDLLVPLIAAISESPTYPIAAYRVGASWLPLSIPQITFNLSGLASGSSVTFTCPTQGDNTSLDIYVTPYIEITPAAIIVDPGVIGLPYLRKTYRFSKYSSWGNLFADINQDCLTGFLPFNLTSTSGVLTQTPTSSIVHRYYASYPSNGTTIADLTSASSWEEIARLESIPGDDFGFIVLSGLSGKALSSDIESAKSILDSLTLSSVGNITDLGSQITSDPILIIPWSLTPPVSGIVYDPSSDITAAQTLLAGIGAQRARNILIFWGFGYHSGFPTYLGNSVLLPGAYAAISSILRESSTSENPLRPHINILNSISPPYFSGSITTEPPSGIVATTNPSLASMENMRLAGINTLTQAIGPYWTIHGPISLLDGSSFGARLAVLLLKTKAKEVLSQYLGKSNTQETLKAIQATLDSLVSQFKQGTTSISRQVAALSLDLLASMKNLDTINIVGSLSLYSEVRNITFQIDIKR